MFMFQARSRRGVWSWAALAVLLSLGCGAAFGAEDFPGLNGLGASAGDPLDSNDYRDGNIDNPGDDPRDDSITVPPSIDPGALSPRGWFGLGRDRQVVVLFAGFDLGLPVVRIVIYTQPSVSLEGRYERR